MKASLTPSRVFLLCCRILLLGTFITACGGSGGGGKKVLTGVFIDGPVQGLGYETATQSGLTDAAGRFSYRAGETVTFSIGGIELGSAAGAAQLDPFDLAGMTPPTSELALRLELGTRNDVTDFDRAANIAFLLVSLDDDANPGNGLDLTGWDSALAAAELDLNVNLYKFVKKFRRFAGAHNINPNVTVMQPLTHLYQSLGIAVPINLLDGINEDTNDDNVADNSSQYTYNPSGQMILRTFDPENDGSANESKSFTYTSQGRVATQNRARDSNDDGVFELVENREFTYNSNGDTSLAIFEVPDITATVTHAYNSLGDLVSALIENESDVFADGTIEHEYTYDEHGNLLENVQRSDSGQDGSVDDVKITLFTYDAAGNLLTRQENEYGNDTVVDISERQVYTYDAAGNILTATFTEDADGDGPGATSSKTTVVNTYNSKGNLATTVSEGRDDGINLSSRQVDTHTYNGDGTLLMSSVRETDSDGDFNLDSIRTSTFTYDAHGNPLTQRHETDNVANGVGIDTVSEFGHEYATLNDGMFALLYHYLDTSVLHN